MALPYVQWFWGEALAFDGIYLASRGLGDAAGEEWIRSRVLDWGEQVNAPLAPSLHVTPGGLLARLYEESQDERYLNPLMTLYQLYEGVAVDRTGCLLHRTDVVDWHSLAWVDAMYYDGPFLARLGRALDKPCLYNMAGSVMRGYVAALWDHNSHLFSHYYNGDSEANNAVHWARGNGWALLGLVDMAAVLPAHHWARDWSQGMMYRLVQRLMEWQDASGFWHTVIDDAQSYLEGSLAAMFVAAVAKAKRHGLLQTDAGISWRRAWNAVEKLSDGDGSCRQMSDVTPWGDDLDHYRKIGFAVTPWGQGAWLRAAIEAAYCLSFRADYNGSVVS